MNVGLSPGLRRELERKRFPWSYAMALLTFPTGLAMPEGWVKRNFAPELLVSEAEEYWPRKPE